MERRTYLEMIGALYISYLIYLTQVYLLTSILCIIYDCMGIIIMYYENEIYKCTYRYNRGVRCSHAAFVILIVDISVPR